MNDSNIFVFGSKIFLKEMKRDAITALPLELSWRIFSYLDDASLRVAYSLNKTWARIITANLNLRRRLNRFELALKLGPNLAKFHRRNKRRVRRGRNYLQTGETIIFQLDTMKVVFFTCLLATIVVVQCKHLFLGTNVGRPMVHHQNFQTSAKVFRKSVENVFYQLPAVFTGPRAIQGILAVDMTGSTASANVTVGGIGYNNVNIRMKSERGRGLHYDIYIYA